MAVDFAASGEFAVRRDIAVVAFAGLSTAAVFPAGTEADREAFLEAAAPVSVPLRVVEAPDRTAFAVLAADEVADALRFPVRDAGLRGAAAVFAAVCPAAFPLSRPAAGATPVVAVAGPASSFELAPGTEADGASPRAPDPRSMQPATQPTR